MSGEIVTFIETGQLKVKEPREGWRGRFFHSRTMTFAYYTVVAGAWIHKHSHPNDEVWNVVDGQLEITIAGETRVAGPRMRRGRSSGHCSLSEGPYRRASDRCRLPAPSVDGRN
jgi:hypothetical protein